MSYWVIQIRANDNAPWVDYHNRCTGFTREGAERIVVALRKGQIGDPPCQARPVIEEHGDPRRARNWWPKVPVGDGARVISGVERSQPREN